MSKIHRQVKMIAPIDSMQGMIGKTSDNVCGKAIILNLKQRMSQTNDGKPFQYFSVRTKAGISQTPAMRNWAEKFGQICSQTHLRLQDPTYVNTDRVEFAKQTKYKTLWSFVFRKVQDTVNV